MKKANSNLAESAERTTFPLWQRAMLFCAAYFLCAEASNLLSVQGTTYVSFWLPAGLYVAVLLMSRSQEWPWLVLATLPANLVFDLLHGSKLVLIPFFFLANAVQSVGGAWLVRRFVAERPTLATLKEFAGLLGFAAVLSTMLGAVIGAATLTFFGLSHSFVQSWKVWWGSTAMAILLLSPFFLTWLTKSTAHLQRFKQPEKILEAALLLLVLIAITSQLLFADQGIMSPNKGWVLLPLLWAGLRFGPRGATAANLLVSLLVAFFTTQHFTGLTPDQISSGGYIFVLQTSLAVMALVGLIPAIVLGERDKTTAELRDSEERFRNLTEAAFEGIALSENGRITDANDQMLKMFGYERADMIGRQVIELVAPESRAVVAESIRLGREEIYEHRLLRKDGSSFFAEARAKMVHVGGRTLRMTALRDITERKSNEEALRASQELFRAIIEDQTEMIVRWKPDGTRTFVNSAYCRVFGGTRAEFIGTSFFPLISEQDREIVLARIHALTPANPVSTAVHRSVSPVGDVLWQEWTDRAIFDGNGRLVELQSTGRDITDRRRAEAALRASEESLRATIENTPHVAVQWYDAQGCVLFWNSASEKIFGWKSAEALGKTIDQIIFTPETAAGFLEAIAEIGRTGKPIGPVEYSFHRRDGSPGTCLSTVFRIPFVSGQSCFVCMDVDLTDRKDAEESLRRLRERELLSHLEFTQQLIASQEAERTRIAAELHDSLGQNLLIIKNRAQLALTEKTAPADARAQLEGISALASQAIAEVRQISHDLHPYQLDHLGLTRALEVMIDSTAQASGIVFERKLDAVDNVFSADAATNLYRVVQESLNNILKHSRAKRARIELARDVREVQLRIEDDGCGFKNGEVGNGGKGLGLKNIAERVRILNGSLKVDSQPERGTHIEVTIPIAEIE